MRHKRRSHLIARVAASLGLFALIIVFAAISTASSTEVDSLSRFDSDTYPPIDIRHNPPVVVTAGEKATLTFGAVCGLVDENDHYCEPNLTLFVRYGTDEPQALDLTVRSVEGIDAFSATVAATDTNGQPVSYFVEASDPATGVASRLPVTGWITPAIVDELVQVDLSAASSVAISSTRVASFTWGRADNQVGLSAGTEQATVGPESFDVSDEGDIVVFDGVNERLVLHGRSGTNATIETPGIRSADVSFDGTKIALVDPFGERQTVDGPPIAQFVEYTIGGHQTTRVPVYLADVAGFNEAGEVVAADGLSIERRLMTSTQAERNTHRQSIKLGSLAVLWSDGAVRLYDGAADLGFELSADMPLGPVPFFARTPGGYVVGIEEAGTIAFFWFDAAGKTAGSVAVPVTNYTDFRPTGRVAIDGEGAIFVLDSDRRGVSIVKVAPPATNGEGS